jgi:cytoskeletal protein RodZ
MALTRDGQCPGCGVFPEGFDLKEVSECAVAWSYTDLLKMKTHCAGCGCLIEAEQSFCSDCEAELKAIVNGSFAELPEAAPPEQSHRTEKPIARVEPQPAAPPRRKFSRSALALLAAIPVVVTAFWLSTGSKHNSQPDKLQLSNEASVGSTMASEAARPQSSFSPSASPTEETRNSSSAGQPVAVTPNRPSVRVKALRPAPTVTRRPGASPTAAPAPPVRTVTPAPARPAAAPTVHSRPRRVFQSDQPEALHRSEGAKPTQQSAGTVQSRKKEKPLQAGVRWPLRFFKNVGKKAALLVR